MKIYLILLQIYICPTITVKNNAHDCNILAYALVHLILKKMRWANISLMAYRILFK